MPVKDNEVIEHLTPEETLRFLNTARAWPARDEGNMFLLAFFTGIRRGEMFKLRDKDVAFDLKFIRLRDPKDGKTLSIGMSALAEDLLRGQINWRDENYPGNPFIFPGKDGEMRKDCSAVDRFRKAAGLPLNKAMRLLHSKISAESLITLTFYRINVFKTAIQLGDDIEYDVKCCPLTTFLAPWSSRSKQDAALGSAYYCCDYSQI